MDEINRRLCVTNSLLSSYLCTLVINKKPGALFYESDPCRPMAATYKSRSGTRRIDFATFMPKRFLSDRLVTTIGN